MSDATDALRLEVVARHLYTLRDTILQLADSDISMPPHLIRGQADLLGQIAKFAVGVGPEPQSLRVPLEVVQ